ncbi:hypothetical protein BT96DRAFT_928108, partial [Gymnopus androsaceus JB14]
MGMAVGQAHLLDGVISLLEVESECFPSHDLDIRGWGTSWPLRANEDCSERKWL